jgi:hypothetical protein
VYPKAITLGFLILALLAPRAAVLFGAALRLPVLTGNPEQNEFSRMDGSKAYEDDEAAVVNIVLRHRCAVAADEKGLSPLFAVQGAGLLEARQEALN